MDFDIYYTRPDGGSDHSIIEANYMSEAVEHIESTKGGIVYKAEMRETLVSKEATGSLSTDTLKYLFELKQKSEDRSDSTARYSVVLRHSCTVREFISAIVMDPGFERGNIRIVPEFWTAPIAQTDYNGDVCVTNSRLLKFYDFHVKEAEADGGWGSMDFEIILK